MLKNLKEENKNLHQQIIELENEIKEQDEELTDMNNDLKNREEKLEECNFIINEEKGKNYQLQKKLKELNEKLILLEDKNIQNLNINDKKQSNENNYETNYKQLIPKNFNILKSFHLQINNKQFKWYILEKQKLGFEYLNSEKENRKLKIKEEESSNDSNNNLSYDDFIFIPEKDKDKLNKFKLPLNDSFENEKIINDLKSNLKTLEKKFKKKEKDFNVLNINFMNLLKKNKVWNENQEKLKNIIETLKEENQNLNKNLMKYSHNSNFLGISFIEEDDNDKHFFEDKCFEDILNELDNRDKINGYRNGTYIKRNNINNRNENNFYSPTNKIYQQNYKTIDNKTLNDNIVKDNYVIKNLKENFKILLNQIELSQNAKITTALIMKLLGHKENEILKIIGNKSRGVITIPNSNKNKNVNFFD